METLSESIGKSSPLAGNRLLTMDLLSMSVVGALLITGIVFKTYWITTSPPELEALRRIGIVFLAFEAAIVLLAFSRGFSVATAFAGMGRFDKIALAVFVAFMLPGGLLNSPITALATSISLTMLFHMLFASAIWYSVPEITRRDVERFGLIIFLGLLAFLPLLLWTFAFPPLEIDRYNHQWQFAVPGFISVRTFGGFTGAVTAFFVGLALSDRSRERLPRWVLLAVTLAGGLTLWSGTRAAVLAVGVSLVVMAAQLRWKIKLAHLWQLGLCLPLAVAGALVLQPYGDPAFSLFAVGDSTSPDALTGGRLSYWAKIVEAISHHVWLGAGSAAAGWILPPPGQNHVQPHNIILQFWLSWGLIATVAAVFLLGRATAFAHTVAKKNALAVPFMAMIVSLLVNSLFDGTFYFARHLMLSMIAYGVIFALARQGYDGRLALPD